MSDNQVIQRRLQQQQRSDKFEGGSWNNSSWKPQNQSNFFSERVSFTKNQILDTRGRKYDKRGRLIELFDDNKCSFLCLGVDIPEARELVRLQRLWFVPALAGENVGLTQTVADIISPQLNLNISPSQAQVVASVLQFTYQSLGVQQDSVNQYVSRNFPDKATKYAK